jgi:hypothetical protein
LIEADKALVSKYWPVTRVIAEMLEEKGEWSEIRRQFLNTYRSLSGDTGEDFDQKWRASMPC